MGCLAAGLLVAGGLQTRAEQRSADRLPDYVRVVNHACDVIPRVPDSTYYRVAGRTIFVVNRTELRKNDPFLQELADSIIPLANSRGWDLVGVDLRGAASPEGPYLNNVRLSKGRAAALGKFMSDRLIYTDSVSTSVTTVAEDYPQLLWMLERDGDEAAGRVREILEESHGRDDLAKSLLMREDGGRLWKRLLSDYFPVLRAARVILYFRPIRPEIELTEEYLTVPGPTTEVLEVPLVDVLDLPVRWIDRPHLLSVSTNLLEDAFYMPQYGWAPSPNVAVEWFASPNWTLRAQFLFPYYHRWSKHKFFQIRDYHLEVRRYFKPGPLHTGPYLAAYANATKYGIGLSARKGWEGEGIGGALKAGWVVPLGSGRWRLDFHVAAGYFMTRYDPYVWGNPITGEYDGKYYYDYTGKPGDFHKRNHRLHWFGPTEVGVTLSYDLLYKRIMNRGVSTRSKEVLP